MKRVREEIFGEFNRRFDIQDEIKQEGEKRAKDKILLGATTALEKIRTELLPEIKKFERYERDGKA